MEAIRRIEEEKNRSSVFLHSEKRQRVPSISKLSVEHDSIMQVISAAESHSKETYERIKHRLRDLKELSASNLALKRLIKRNMKEETRFAQALGQRGRQMFD